MNELQSRRSNKRTSWENKSEGFKRNKVTYNRAIPSSSNVGTKGKKIEQPTIEDKATMQYIWLKPSKK